MGTPGLESYGMKAVQQLSMSRCAKYNSADGKH